VHSRRNVAATRDNRSRKGISREKRRHFHAATVAARMDFYKLLCLKALQISNFAEMPLGTQEQRFFPNSFQRRHYVKNLIRFVTRQTLFSPSNVKPECRNRTY